jgi:hypothetical protein
MTNVTLEYKWSIEIIHKIIKWIFQKMNINNINITTYNCNINIASVIGFNSCDFFGMPSYITMWILEE